MSSEYDHQLLESVAVRRNRLAHAVLFGDNRSRRGYVDGLRRMMVGVVLAALVAAGCVGYSFVRHALDLARAQETERSAPPIPSSTPSTDPSPSTWESGR